MKQSTLAAEQFGATAQAYLTSAVHAQGADLQRLGKLTAELAAKAAAGLDALDLGSGAGHVAFTMAEAGARVVASDLSPQMLSVVAEEAGRRGLKSLRTQQNPAEALPFPDACFDLVCTRFSAHHWSNVPAALREVRRVLKPGGTLVVIDVAAPEMPLLDTVLQTVEILRDASHVRDFRVSEWTAMLQDAGFSVPRESDTWKLRMVFDTWVARMRTPEVRVAALRDVLGNAPEEAKQHFSIGPDASFDIDVAWLRLDG